MYYNFRWVACENWFWSCVESVSLLNTRSDSKIARKDGTTEVPTGTRVCFCIGNRAIADVPDVCTCTVDYKVHHVSHWECNRSEKVNMHNDSFLVFSWRGILYFLMLSIYDLSNKGWWSLSAVIIVYQCIYWLFLP